MNNLDKMARIGREIEKRMEAAREKAGRAVSVVMMPPEAMTLHGDEFAEDGLPGFAARAVLHSTIAFAQAGFGTEASVERIDKKIPNASAPCHADSLKVDAAMLVAHLAA